jgi:ABC-2 type transport system ATP-binding protein
MIEIRDLQKVSGRISSIDIPALDVGRGEIAAMVGPAGSGKTLLFDLLAGRTRPTAGTIRLAGSDPFQDQAQLSQVAGFLFAEDAVYNHLSPLGNLEFHCQLYGLPKSRAAEVLAQVGLGDQANSKPDQLSSSLLRRLGFGRSYLHSPKILLFLEPFTRCDRTTIRLLSNLMRSQAEAGTALLILATEQSNLGSLCNVIYILNQGKIAETLHPQEDDDANFPFKIPAKVEDKKVVLLNPAEILYAYASEGRAYLVTDERHLPTQFTLSEIEERLSRSGFFRAHRAYLVNLQHVKEVIPYTRNSFSLRLTDPDNTEIPLSKSAASELSDLLGY